MEMRQVIRHILLQGFCLCLGILLLHQEASAQASVKKYSIKDGKMVIELSKLLPEKELDEFIQIFDLADLDLKHFLKTNNPDSLQKLGWTIQQNTTELLIITKPLFSFDIMGSPIERIINATKIPSMQDILPLNNTNAAFGYNKFRNKHPFKTADSVITFFLRNNLKAKQVLLAGNFTNWQESPITMQLTDSGWIAPIKLTPGKYWYKFIVDDRWITDPDNQLNENDGRGNTNSVYYATNTVFSVTGYTGAKKVYLSGSFNNWKEKELLMNKTATGWELPLMLPEGTHTYKFIADGKWMADEKNPERLPDGNGGYNSVIRLGNTYTFKLNGYTGAKKVIVSGSFNGWKEDELEMKRTATGWELPYVIGPGNYEYKFIVDGNWIADPANSYTGNDGNSFMVVAANYTFRLKADGAKKVYLAGDFNGWNPGSLLMKKEGDTWVFHIYLSPGKHRYKFFVDGEWILDPANKLWEQNEYNTGNSIVWIGQ